jgi:hypothetical protein
MPVDYGALLYDPVYAEIGVPATLTLADGNVAVVYEPQYIKQGWFDDQATPPGWFDEELQGRGSSQVEITVIDDTRPKVLPISNAVQSSTSADVRTVGPGAFARIYELDGKGITRDLYMDATLTFNGRTWTVRSYELRGSPNGEDLGEVRFLLKASALP